MKILVCVTLASILIFPEFSHAQSQPDTVGPEVMVVSLQDENQIPLRAISEIAIQSGMPIGIAFGADQQMLCSKAVPVHIKNRPVDEAVTEIARTAGFSVETKDGVLVMTAPDLTSLQLSILGHRFEQYPQQSASSMAALGARLTGAIRMEIGNESTFAASILHSVDSDHVSLSASTGLSTEDIANRIVKLDKRGLWIFRGATHNADTATNELPSPRDAEIRVFSYADNLDALRSITCDR
jgi:hypothetical protein